MLRYTSSIPSFLELLNINVFEWSIAQWD
jgi:hypothetical protein